MRVFAFLFILCALVIETGCSAMSHKSDEKTFFSEDLDQLKDKEHYEPIYDELSIKDAFEKSANLPKPFRMAVYFKEANKRGQATWRWKQDDQVRIMDSLRAAIDKDTVANMFMIDESLVKEDNLPAIRLAAASYKADAVLIVDGNSELNDHLNKWALSYALIVPALFIRGNTVDSLFKIKANLWDVRNGGLYFTTRSEGEMKKNFSIAWGEGHRVYAEQTKELAIADFEKEIKAAFKR